MSIATGTIEYTLEASPVSGCGVSWSIDELDAALSGPVLKVVFDDSGKADISALLSGLTETDFEKSQVERILADTKPPEDWRVGEALAESYLVHQRDCFFHGRMGAMSVKPAQAFRELIWLASKMTMAKIILPLEKLKPLPKIPIHPAQCMDGLV